jgi:hypothetical protein
MESLFSGSLRSLSSTKTTTLLIVYCAATAIVLAPRPKCLGQEHLDWHAVEGKDNVEVITRRLNAMWKNQITKINTAHMTFKHMNFLTKMISRDELYLLIDSLDLVEFPDRMNVLDEKLRFLEDGQELLYKWAEMELWQEGRKVREQNNAKNAIFVHILDGKHKLVYDEPTNQATIAVAGSELPIIVYDADDYRYVPRSIEFEKILSIETSGDLLRIRWAIDKKIKRELVVSGSTGFAFSNTEFSPNGHVLSEVMQKSPTESSEGIIFPGMSVLARYKKGLLYTLKLSILEVAEYNIPIDDEMFQLSLPSGTTVVDMRGGQPTSQRLPVAVNNALEAFGKPLRLPQNSGEASSRTTYRLFMSLNILVVVILATLIARKFILSSKSC